MKDPTKNENLSSIIDTKILYKMLANGTQEPIKRIIHHDQFGLTPEIQQ